MGGEIGQTVGHQVEVAEGLMHEGRWGIFVLCKCKQLADQSLCIVHYWEGVWGKGVEEQS